MFNKFIYGILILTGIWSYGQQCPSIGYPLNGTLDIPVDATITWPSVPGINGYLISLGSTPGGADIVSSLPLGQETSYKAPTGLPPNTQIYASLSIIPFDQPPISCPGITFRTMMVTSPPGCTILVAPDDNANNVTIITDIIWAYAPMATGYRLSIGTTPDGVDLVNDEDMGNVLAYDPPSDLPHNANIFVRIVPYNDYGDMGICTEETFSTGAAAYSCDPIINELTGEAIARRPIINFPSQIGICGDELPYTITTHDEADGFRWFKTNEGSEETLLSESRSVPISAPGRYRYEAYNNIPNEGGTVECADFTLFDVVVSGAAVIESIGVVFQTDHQKITIGVSGAGVYEFALDNRDGPFQDSPNFDMASLGSHVAYVRDKNGCGVVERSVDRDISIMDFPKFFTPNGDGIHDYWQFVPPLENFELSLETIYIYDRYGILVYQVDPISMGWDGNFQGLALPSSDYWFRAIPANSKEIKGHFTLKR